MSGGEGVGDAPRRVSTVIAGDRYHLIPYGDETDGNGEPFFSHPCHVCGTGVGDLHADSCTLGRGHPYRRPPFCRDCATPVGGIHRLGCCLEQCPRCEGQYASCPCVSDEDDS